jgi:hypothetical protein
MALGMIVKKSTIISAKKDHKQVLRIKSNAVCKASSFEEPCAVIPHAGICEGAVG